MHDPVRPRAGQGSGLPGLLAALQLPVNLTTAFVFGHDRIGDPVPGAVIGGVGLLFAQVLVLRLTERWSNAQDGSDDIP